jgi:hypothetical protein
MNIENNKQWQLDLWAEPRLVFMSPPEVSRIQASKKEDLLPLEQEVKNAKENLEVNKVAIGVAVQEFNKKYSASDFNDKGYSMFGDSKTKQKEHPEEQPLKLDLSNLSSIRRQIQELEPELQRVKADTITSHEDQLKDLETIKGLLDENLSLSGTLGQRESNENSQHQERLIQLEKETREKYAKNQEKWSESDAYKEALGVFQSATTTLDGFKMDRNGKESDQALRENKELFLSILASQTDNFKKGSFPLGDRFQNEPEDNKKNFPFIYHEFVEKNGGEKATREKSEWEVKVGQAETKANKADRNNIPAAVTTLVTANAALNLIDRTDATHIPFNSNNLSEYNLNLAKAIEQMVEDVKGKKVGLRDILKRDPNNQDTKTSVQSGLDSCDTLIKNLESVHQLALATKELREWEGKLDKVENGFTREKLDTIENRKLLIEWSMGQFLKAREIVDEAYGPKGENAQGLIHPTARRELIAMVFDQGVSRYRKNNDGTETYEDSNANDYRWMLSKAYQSPYFNSLRQNKHLDAENRDFLILARYANKALAREGVLKNTIDELSQIDVLFKANATDPNATKRLADFNKNSWSGTPLTATDIPNQITIFGDRLKLNAEFRTKVETIMARKPASDMEKDLNAYKDDMRRDISGLIGNLKNDPETYKAIMGSDKGLIDDFSKKMENVEIYYNSMDYNEKSRSNFMEMMGIDMIRLYGNYLDYLKVDKDMKVDQWDNFLLKDGNVDRLAKMFEVVIPEGKTNNGKADFIKSLQTLHGTYPNKTTPENMNGQSVVVRMYECLKAEIIQREKLSDKEAQEDAQVKSQLEGMTFGDKITEYGHSVINMAIGPGQSLANRAAGIAMIVMAWKLISRAYKGEKDDKLGQALRYLGLAGATELMIKHVTGAGVLDRFKITGVANAMKGTYEGVLLNRGKNLDISSDEHARALAEIKHVPMKSLLEWYRNSTPAGLPITGQDNFPKEINISNFVRGMNLKQQDEKLRGRFVVKQVMKNFLGYVGEKKQGDDNTGATILNEEWIKPAEDENFNLDKATKADIRFDKGVILDGFKRNNLKSLTWDEVVKAEIKLDDLDAVNEGSWLSVLERNASAAVKKGSEILRQDIMDPGSAAFTRNYERLSARYGLAIKDLPKNLYVMAEEKKDELVVWWENGQTPIRIRRTAENMYRVIETAALVPFLGTAQAAELTSDTLLGLVNKLNDRRKEFFGEAFKVTYDLFPTGLDIHGNIQSPAATEQRGLLVRTIGSHGYEMFGRFKSDFYEGDGTNRKCARGLLSNHDFMTNRNSHFHMNPEEGYVAFAGLGPKGDPEAAYQNGIRELVEFLRDNRANIDNTTPEGRNLLAAIDSNDESLVGQHIRKYVDRFGILDTNFNGEIMFMHFPFPTNSTATTWNKEIVWKGPGMALPAIYPDAAGAYPAAARSQIVQNVKYRGRYEELAKGEGHPSFEKYKKSIVFSARDDLYTEGYMERPNLRDNTWTGEHIDNYKKEFHLWDTKQVKALIGIGLGLVDGLPISEFGEYDNKADALFAALKSRKEEVLKQSAPEKNFVQTRDVLRKFGSQAVADEFTKIHSSLDDYFSAKTLGDRVLEVKDWMTVGNSFKLRYREYLMEHLSEMYRDNHNRNITVADLNKVTKEFIAENGGMVEAWLKRVIKVPNAVNNILNGLLNNKYFSLDTNPPKKIIK